jgi:hypothetical protein
MAMFGTTQGTFLAPKEHAPIVAPEPSGSTPPKGVVAQPEKTKTVSPSGNKIK